MHPQYLPTLQTILTWAQSNPDIHGVILIGSQARATLRSDQWSDLDLMVFAADQQRTMQDSAWLNRFGEVVCFFDEIVPLHFTSWNWCVKRVLYTDHRDVDFSILPYDRLDEVLSVNQDILSKGYQILYDPCGSLLESKIRDLFQSGAPAAPQPPAEQELRLIVSELLYHVIWAYKKIRRDELWVAVNCINTHMKALLLRLIEAHNLLVRGTPDILQYNGRFLEQRADPEILAKLAFCFTRYDRAGAIAALENLLEITHTLSSAIYEKTGYPFNAAEFEGIKKVYHEMKAE